MKKLIFDTLSYAKMLTKGGVSCAEAHAESLATALAYNIYVKDEVDKMIKNTLARFDQKFDDSLREFHDRSHRADRRFEESLQEFRERTHQIEKQTIEIKVELNKIVSRNTLMTITILGSLMTLFTFVAHLMH